MADKFMKSITFVEGGDAYYPLPKVTNADDGKVLKVVDGEWSTTDMILPNYLSFIGTKDFVLTTTNEIKNWDGTLEYSTDTITWRTWNGTRISSVGGKLYLRGIGNTKITGDPENFTSYNFYFIVDNPYAPIIACEGNIENLLDYETVSAGDHPTMADYCFAGLFYACMPLATAPDLPATTLAKGCYVSMFGGCMFLKTAPALPATTLAENCYMGMFYGCRYLETAPALPATTLAVSCYYGMFQGCKSLTTAPALPATTLAEGCYYNMFCDCTSLTTAPALPATTLANGCYMSMFSGCTSLTTIPALPATTLAVSCYYGMLGGCTSLTTIPALPATTLVDYCYSEMLKDCTKIKLSTTQTGEYQTPYRMPTSGTGTAATDALTDMFTNTGGTFTGSPIVNTTYYTSNTVV